MGREIFMGVFISGFREVRSVILVNETDFILEKNFR